MPTKKSGRKRGMVLTEQGLKKLRQAIRQVEEQDNYGERFTQEDLRDRVRLNESTISKVLNQEKVQLSSIEAFFEAFDLAVADEDWIFPFKRSSETMSVDVSQAKDWIIRGNISRKAPFYGRIQEQKSIIKWFQEEECGLVVVTGMGGIGKTSLAVKIALENQHKYQIIWQSLKHTPILKNFLHDLLFLLTGEKHQLQPDIRSLIVLLIQYFSHNPCLLILDQFESILTSNSTIGQYQSDYENYTNLLHQLNQEEYQSRVLIISRESLPEIAYLQSSNPYTHTLELTGSTDTCQAILNSLLDKCKSEKWCEIINFYNGHPLAITLVSRTINELFDGDINDFIDQNHQGARLPIIGYLRRLLEEHFERLSTVEYSIIYWLAINREPVSIRVIQDDLMPTVPRNAVVEALRMLRSRSLITLSAPSYINEHHKGFALRGFVLEYTTHKFVELIGQELRMGRLDLFNSYALIKASAQEHIQDSQKRFILDPICQKLLTWMTPQEIKVWVQNILKDLRSQNSTQNNIRTPEDRISVTPLLNQSSTLTGYTAGNLLNLLIHLGIKIINHDFSHLAVWQADLRNARLHGVNFTGADLSKSVFTEVIGDVLAVTYSPRGNLLATTDSDGKLHLWTTKDAVKQYTCDCRGGWVRALAFSPDQKTVVTGDDRTVKVWDVETGQLLKALQRHQDWVRSVCFALHGRILASCSDDQTIKLWDRDINAHLPPLEAHNSRIKTIACNSDQMILASGSDDGTIQLWSLSYESSPPPTVDFGPLSSVSPSSNVICQQLRTISVKHQVRFVTFHPSHPYTLASSSDDKVIRLWDIQTGFCLKEFAALPAWVRSLAFSPDGRYLASSGDDNHIHIWDVESGTRAKTLVGHRSRIWSIAFSPDGQTLVSGSDSQTLKFWDVAQEKCVKTFQGYTRGIRTLAFHPTQSWLVSSGDDKAVRVWQLPITQVEMQRTERLSPYDLESAASGTFNLSPNPEFLNLKEFKGHEGRVWSVAIHPNGEWIASASDDKTIRLWHIQTGHCLRLKGHNDWIRSVAFGRQPKTGQIVLASGSDDRTIKLWDVETGECLKTIQYHTDWVRAVAFSSNFDIPLLASGSDNQTVGNSDNTIKLWDLSTDCPYRKNLPASGVRALAFSPDGKLLASGSDDKTVRICDVEKGCCLLKLPHHSGRVWSVAFSPDGQTLASSSDDRTVKVWDVETGNIIACLTDHARRVYAVAFSPDGTVLATGSEDGKIRFWDVQKNYRFIDRLKVLKPYHQTCIRGITGVTPAQKLAMMETGAIQN